MKRKKTNQTIDLFEDEKRENKMIDSNKNK
jgi:hypothetical protein